MSQTRGGLYHRGRAGAGHLRAQGEGQGIHDSFCNTYIVSGLFTCRIVREFLDEITASTVHRCTDVEFMDQSVSGV